MPLPQAFWWYGIVYGFVINALSTLAALAIASTDGPNWLVVVAYLFPLPYELLILVGVWRSAASWQGAPRWAILARLAIVLWVAAAMAF